MQLHAGSDQTFLLIAPEGQKVTAARALKGAPVKLAKDGTIRVKSDTTLAITLQ